MMMMRLGANSHECRIGCQECFGTASILDSAAVFYGQITLECFVQTRKRGSSIFGCHVVVVVVANDFADNLPPVVCRSLLVMVMVTVAVATTKILSRGVLGGDIRFET